MKKFILILCIYFGFVCSLCAEEKFPFIGEVTAKKLNIRAGYNINFETFYKLENSQKVEVLDREFNWYKIKLPKEAGCFISVKYIDDKSDSDAVVTGQRVNVRARPDTKSSVLCQVGKEDSVRIVKKYDDDWYQIQAPDDCCGWVYDKYVKYYSTPKQYKKEQEKELAKIDEETEWLVEKEDLAEESKLEEKFDFEQKGIIRRLTTFFPHPGTHRFMQNGKTICYLKGDKAKLNSFVNLEVKILGNTEKESTFSHPVVIVEKILILE
ncbi:MAG: SH3 domain-containing protein [Candidatus Omnitrophota bacterium]